MGPAEAVRQQKQSPSFVIKLEAGIGIYVSIPAFTTFKRKRHAMLLKQERRVALCYIPIKDTRQNGKRRAYLTASFYLYDILRIIMGGFSR